MHSGRSATILVVEDEAIVARDIQRTLLDLGYQVLGTCASCDEAILRASERCPDLVLMDIRIQGQRDGVETAELLRKRFGVPVVFLTAYADDITLERAKRAQPYGYLIKPIKSHELRSSVEVALYKHEMDAHLRSRERWFSTTLRSIGDAVISTDVAARVTFMNAAAEQLTGWRSDEAVGRPLEEVLPLESKGGDPLADSPVRQALREGRVAKLADGVALRARDGAERPIEDSAAPIVDGDDVLGAVMVFRDVGEQRRLQQQIELTARLASVGTMAAGVSSEIDQPLSAIANHVAQTVDALQQHRSELRQLFSDEAYASVWKRLDEIEAKLADAAEEAQRASRIVAELRTFAQPSAERAGAIDLRRVLSRAGEIVAHEIRSRACLAMEIGQVPAVDADEGRLGQVFVNLLLNAAQAIAPGNARANEVRVTGRTAPDGRALVEVRDTGCGIPEGLRKRIFDPFFTTKTVGTGTGLGLSICHGIVNALGGEIQVDSQVGRGSVFRVFLPPAAQRQPTMTLGRAERKTPRVLVVHSDRLVALSARRTLEPAHEVLVAKNVREATSLLDRGESYDVILCALELPDVTGMDLYDDLLRSRPEIARRVVFLRGTSASARAVEFIESVSNPCLDLPFAQDTLRAVVRQTIAGSEAA